MIGVILLAVSWLLLRLEGQGLAAIGLDQPLRRLRELAIGFGAFGIAAALQQLSLSAVAGDPFVWNSALRLQTFVEGGRFVLNSVLYEEFLFRGYLLYRAIRWFGAPRAVLLDACAFGVYHWFSQGALGNPMLMVYLLLVTGSFGWAWARVFVVTGSIAAPIGLHLGWNAVSYLVFSSGPLGGGLFVPSSGARQIQVGAIASLALHFVYPLLLAAGTIWHLRAIDRRRTVPSTAV